MIIPTHIMEKAVVLMFIRLNMGVSSMNWAHMELGSTSNCFLINRANSAFTYSMPMPNCSIARASGERSTYDQIRVRGADRMALRSCRSQLLVLASLESKHFLSRPRLGCRPLGRKQAQARPCPKCKKKSFAPCAWLSAACCLCCLLSRAR